MGGWVTVMEPSEYQAWLTGGSSNESLEQAGQALFTRLACVCVSRRRAGAGRGPARSFACAVYTARR